jgi:hypothetical protein
MVSRFSRAVSSGRETAREHARHAGQNPPQRQMQDPGKIRSADQDALNFDARAECGSFRARVRDDPEQVAVGNFELNDIARGKLERRPDTKARTRNVGDLAEARPSRVGQPGDVRVEVGQVAMIETAFHG